MNPEGGKEAERLFSSVVKSISDVKNTEVIFCPPFVYLDKLKKVYLGQSHTSEIKKVGLGAQNLFFEDSGAYTGEISGEMLYDIGVRYVIVGHSERRNPPFSSLGGAGGESNLEINKKMKSALKARLRPILCVGEKERDENHKYLNFVKTQIVECLDGIPKDSMREVIIAYEPVWAIGKGAVPANPLEFQEMNIFIKKILSDKFGAKNISKVRIIYGGSVDAKNAEEFLKIGQADGFLVGRASLDAKKFEKIIKTTESE